MPNAAHHVTFRWAEVRDAAALAPLIFRSGRAEFSYLLGGPAAECVAYLRYAAAMPYGRFSARRHRVAVLGEQVVASMCIRDGRATLLDDSILALSLLGFFGWRRTIQILRRALVLGEELPAPSRNQTLIAHCATHEDYGGASIFSGLFDDSMRHRLMCARAGQEIVLDVLLSNSHASSLYRRLGFADTQRARAASPNLPAELLSTRMRLARR
jgi:hypothetical protein